MSEEIEVPKKRPGFLTTLGVLSFVNIGFWFIMALLRMLSGPMSDEQILDQKIVFAEAKNELRKLGADSWTSLYDKLEAMTMQTNDSFYLAMFLEFVVLLIGLSGVIMMFKGRKFGFHVFIIYCLLSLGAAYLYISPSNIPTISTIFTVIISGLFIFLYSRNLRWMK